VDARASGKSWRVTVRGARMIDGAFEEGQSFAQIGGKRIELGAAFHIVNGRGYAPLASLRALLPELLRNKVALDEQKMKLAIGVDDKSDKSDAKNDAKTVDATTPAPVAPVVKAVAPPKAAVFVVIDAAHGGGDNGAALGNGMFEKDLDLAFANQIAGELRSRGIAYRLTRSADAYVNDEQRASTLFAQPAEMRLFISVHVSSSGHGVRIYRAMTMQSYASPHPSFTAWGSAQSRYAERSGLLSAALALEFGNRQISATTGMAAVAPLSHVSGAAAAVEIAPLDGGVRQLASNDYQRQVAQAVANAISAFIPKGGGK